MTASRAVSNRGQSNGPPEGAHLSRRENVVLSGSPLAAFPRWVWPHDMLSWLA